MALTLSANQQTFVRALARMTGLNTRTLQGWVAQEEGVRDHPVGPGGSDRPDQNWLNVGVTDSGPLSLTKNQGWKTPEGAAAETAAFLKGQKYGPSEGIRKIIGTAGRSVAEQIRAIQSSGWASAGETSLAQLAGQTRGLHNIGAPGPAQQSHGGMAHAARAAGPQTQTTTEMTDVAQPQGLADLFSALQSTQTQNQPRAAPASFDPGQSKYLSQTPTPTAQSSLAASSDTGGDLMSLIANAPTPQVAKTVTRAIASSGDPPVTVTAHAAKGAPSQAAGSARASGFANQHIGAYAESAGSNRGPTLDALEAHVGMQGEPWCSMFATTAAVHGGAPVKARTASVPTLAGWAKNGTNGYAKGILPVNQARKGDLIMRGGEHVGFVDGRTANGDIIVIEGNANGSGGVAKRVYSPSRWTGIARPTYRR